MLSRVADSLYWMSRYLERAERTAKLIDVSWKCSRKIMGEKLNTESVQTAKIVIRN